MTHPEPSVPSHAALAAALVLSVLLAACGRSPSTSDAVRRTAAPGPTKPVAASPVDVGQVFDGENVEGVRPPLGGPIEGLSPAELDAFERGRLVFERRFRPSEGLGPRYNATSCVSCHSTPVSGGSAQLYRNFYVGLYDTGLGYSLPIGNLPTLVIPSYGRGPAFSLHKERFPIPTGSSYRIAQRNPIPMFGTGLFEFIADDAILANADPDDVDGDGISGRYNTNVFLGVGRFGNKAQANNLESFTRTPLFAQMGITSEAFLGSAGAISLASPAPQGTGPPPDDPLTDNDGIPDPEIGRQDLGDLIAFSRFLAPPERKEPLSRAAIRGEELFESQALGCTGCHLPSLPSSRGPVEAYTDLLLHDMGPELADGIQQGAPQVTLTVLTSTESEWRTAPLWGVSLHAPFLHDGRAETLREAIEMHGGEGAASRDAFLALAPIQQRQLIEFLEHL